MLPRSQAVGTYAVITEIDVRFFGGLSIATLIDDALERCGDGCDGVFQREDDTSLHRNLGFMVIRVSEDMKRLFEHVGEAAATSGKIRGGIHKGPNYPEYQAIKAPTDQMVLNVAMWEPEPGQHKAAERLKHVREVLSASLLRVSPGVPTLSEGSSRARCTSQGSHLGVIISLQGPSKRVDGSFLRHLRDLAQTTRALK